MSRRMDAGGISLSARRGGAYGRPGAVARSTWRAVAGFLAFAAGVTGEASPRRGDTCSRPARSMPRPNGSRTTEPARPPEPSRRPRGASSRQDRPAPPDGGTSLSPFPASPAARAPRGSSLPRRSFLRRRLRPRDNAATLLRGARAAALVVAALAALALTVPERAQAQTEVPEDWALKPANINAGEQFRLIFVTSTTRDATAIADYNTFVRTRAAAGVAAIQAYADDFTALVSTEMVNARANTLTRATDTDVPIYWVRSATVTAASRLADDYADFYDGTWDRGGSGRNESGGIVSLFSRSDREA